MDDLELLEKYEPVLRFAKSERFFPMAVEPYLEWCNFFPSGAQGAAELFSHLNEPLIYKIGRLNSEQFFLRFVNKPLNDFDAWIWLGGLSLVGWIAAWFFGGVVALEIAIGISLIAALILFMLASPIRLRIIPPFFAVVFFVVLAFVPIRFFFGTIPYISLAVEYFVMLPIYIILMLYILMRLLKFYIEKVLPEGPGLIMDMLSQATEKIAQESYIQYRQILEKHEQPVYYGRVVREKDKEENEWTILQYHFFYAFNDWRLAANGMNHHEGDWEMTAVYLKNNQPYAVLLSQHGAGNIEKWEDMIKAIDKEGKETTHPVIYAALGSHANYSKPDVIRSPSMYKPGRVQRFLFWFDGLIHYLFLFLNPNQKARQIALKELQAMQTNFLAEDAFIYLKDEADHYIVSLPLEIASGDGFRVGFQGDNLKERVLKSSSYLKRVMSDRGVSRPKVKEWKRILLNPEPDWVQYKGLWGVKSLLDDESGPPGPKWERTKKNQTGVKQRVRWSKPLSWLAELEKLKH
ncbi:MAG: hypothetical protein JNM46_05945 [Anaerolineales bacterium]|nr:hypothetical protein [Anaerolineales bacterium]